MRLYIRIINKWNYGVYCIEVHERVIQLDFYNKILNSVRKWEFGELDMWLFSKRGCNLEQEIKNMIDTFLKTVIFRFDLVNYFSLTIWIYHVILVFMFFFLFSGFLCCRGNQILKSWYGLHHNRHEVIIIQVCEGFVSWRRGQPLLILRIFNILLNRLILSHIKSIFWSHSTSLLHDLKQIPGSVHGWHHSLQSLLVRTLQIEASWTNDTSFNILNAHTLRGNWGPWTKDPSGDCVVLVSPSNLWEFKV